MGCGPTLGFFCIPQSPFSPILSIAPDLPANPALASGVGSLIELDFPFVPKNAIGKNGTFFGQWDFPSSLLAQGEVVFLVRGNSGRHGMPVARTW